jgi:hypothetical protein
MARWPAGLWRSTTGKIGGAPNERAAGEFRAKSGAGERLEHSRARWGGQEKWRVPFSGAGRGAAEFGRSGRRGSRRPERQPKRKQVQSTP